MIRVGDSRNILPTLPARSVRTCVTSPPYWNLRDYGHPDQIGNEPTPDLYVANLVAVFRLVRRVLTDDGTVWLNLGTSYASKPFAPWGIKPKDDLSIPHRVYHALTADGWYARLDHVWSKPNPMPESVRDRCTRSHEYVFHLAKSARYYHDADAIREPNTEGTIKRLSSGPVQAFTEKAKNRACRQDSNDQPFTTASGRNKRSVWTITPKPFKGAHFAVMPEKLVEPCILAGSSEKGQCGAMVKRLRLRADLTDEQRAMVYARLGAKARV